VLILAITTVAKLVVEVGSEVVAEWVVNADISPLQASSCGFPMDCTVASDGLLERISSSVQTQDNSGMVYLDQGVVSATQFLQQCGSWYGLYA
jgi:hypothetical protein